MVVVVLRSPIHANKPSEYNGMLYHTSKRVLNNGIKVIILICMDGTSQYHHHPFYYTLYLWSFGPKVRPKKIIVVLPSSGISEKVGSVGRIFFFFIFFFKKHPKCQIWVHFSQKNTQSEQNWVLSRPYFFYFYFWIGSVAEGNTTFIFFFGLIHDMISYYFVKGNYINCYYVKL